MRFAFVAGFLLIYSLAISQIFLVKKDTIVLGEKCELTWTTEETNNGNFKKFWWRDASLLTENTDTLQVPPDMEWLGNPTSDLRFAGDTLVLAGNSKGSASFRFFDGGHFALVDGKKVVANIIVQSPTIPEGDITDIMDIEAFPSSDSIIKKLLWVGLGLLVIALMYIFYRRKKKSERKRDQLPESNKIKLSIEQRLEEIMQHRDNPQKLQWATDELSSVARQYCEENFGINAAEMTSTDLLKELRRLNADQEKTDKLNHLIGLTDQVKFAKAPVQWGMIEEMCQLVKRLNNTQSG